MKCNHCGSEWSVPEKIKKTIEKCPFCGTDLSVKEKKTIMDVLVEYGKKEGLDFFRNSIKINGLLADMFPAMGRERNAIKVGLEKGIGAKIIQLHYEDDERLRDILTVQMEKILLEDAWLSENAAEFVLSTLITASDIVGGKRVRSYKRGEKALKNNIGKVALKDAEYRDEDLGVAKSAKVAGEAKDKQKPTSAQIDELFTEAQKLENDGRYEEAIKTYIKATILGDPESAYRIAEIYYADKSKAAESVRWYTTAANQGHSKSQNSLGYIYEHGEGIDKDLKKAFYWYQKAAISGNRNAQHNLAFFYYQGMGTMVDYGKAFEWYSKAASQGHPGAQNNLGVMYEYGYGVDKDINQAIKWYKAAADNDNEDGLDNYNRCIRIAKV